MAKPKLGYPAIALLDWLCELGPNRRLFSSGGAMSPRGLYLYEASTPDAGGKQRLSRIWPTFGPVDDHPQAQALLDRLGGRDSIDYHGLFQAGYLKVFNALGHAGSDRSKSKRDFEHFVARFEHAGFHWSDNVLIVTPAGHTFWNETGRELASAMRADREAKRAAVARTVLIGRTVTIRPTLPADLAKKIPRDLALPLPARRVQVPYATATVVRETDTRLYVREVRHLPQIGEGGWRGHVIGGNSPNQYVAPSAILVDGCDAGVVERLQAIAREFQESVDAIGERIVAEMLPGLLDLHSRILQKDAERADAVNDALRAAGIKVSTPYDTEERQTAPDDDCPVARGPK